MRPNNLSSVVLLPGAESQNEPLLVTGEYQFVVNERGDLIRVSENTILAVEGLNVCASETPGSFLCQLDHKEAN